MAQWEFAVCSKLINNRLQVKASIKFDLLTEGKVSLNIPPR